MTAPATVGTASSSARRFEPHETIRAREFTLGVAALLVIGATIALVSLPIDT